MKTKPHQPRSSRSAPMLVAQGGLAGEPVPFPIFVFELKTKGDQGIMIPLENFVDPL